ncbi:MAG: organomercurial transporter MerC [Thiotrichales bacterium]
MNSFLNTVSGFFGKSGAIGTLVAAMGCASCFPALGSLGAAIGLGFLTQYEGLFLNTLLPLFATIALVANVLAWFYHRVWYRTLAAMIGPILVLLAMYPLWAYDWGTNLLYLGIALMLVVSLWDIFSPPAKVCRSCEAASNHTANNT